MLNGRLFHICLKKILNGRVFCICFGMDNRLLLTQQHLQWCRQCFWLQRRHLIKVMEKHIITNKKAKTKSTLFRNNPGDFLPFVNMLTFRTVENLKHKNHQIGYMCNMVHKDTFQLNFQLLRSRPYIT